MRDWLFSAVPAEASMSACETAVTISKKWSNKPPPTLAMLVSNQVLLHVASNNRLRHLCNGVVYVLLLYITVLSLGSSDSLAALSHLVSTFTVINIIQVPLHVHLDS